MEGILRARAKSLVGILNGIDPEEWNPAKDPFLARPFDADHLDARKECKAALQEVLRLPVAAEIPLLGMVARIDLQKGVDLVAQIIPELMNRQNVQIVILGQGDETLLRSFRLTPHNTRDRSAFIRILMSRSRITSTEGVTFS